MPQSVNQHIDTSKHAPTCTINLPTSVIFHHIASPISSLTMPCLRQGTSCLRLLMISALALESHHVSYSSASTLHQLSVSVSMSAASLNLTLSSISVPVSRKLSHPFSFSLSISPHSHSHSQFSEPKVELDIILSLTAILNLSISGSVSL